MVGVAPAGGLDRTGGADLMGATTGPILALGAVTVGNRVLLNDKPFDWHIPIAVAIAAGAFSVLEKGSPKVATALAWTAFATVLLSRVDPKVPSPVESLATWWGKTK